MENNELTCPVCRNALTPEERLGFMVYVCDDHGTWLFKNVLREMLWKFSRSDNVMLDKAIKELEESKERWPPASPGT